MQFDQLKRPFVAQAQADDDFRALIQINFPADFL